MFIFVGGLCSLIGSLMRSYFAALLSVRLHSQPAYPRTFGSIVW